MCCSEIWKHQRRSEWNKHAHDSFLWHHMPAKTEEAKEMDRFYAGADEGSGRAPGKTSSLCSMHFNDEDFAGPGILRAHICALRAASCELREKKINKK